MTVWCLGKDKDEDGHGLHGLGRRVRLYTRASLVLIDSEGTCRIQMHRRPSSHLTGEGGVSWLLESLF